MATSSDANEPEEVLSADYLFFSKPKVTKSQESATSKIAKIQSKNWMGSLEKDFKLRDLYLLGSHDSAAFRGVMTYQKASILEQFYWGVRFLDLQVTEYEKDIWLYYGVPCLPLKQALVEINQFIEAQPSEKIVVYLRKSASLPIDWLLVKQCIESTLTAKLVSKDKVDVSISDMDGNIVLIAPNELNIEQSIDLDYVTTYSTSENNLSEFLTDVTKGNLLKEKQEKLIWLECRSRAEIGKRVNEEVLAAQNSCFFNLKKRLYFNVVSFSFVGKTHFSLLKEYFRIWNR